VKELEVAGVTPPFILVEAVSYMALPHLSYLPLALLVLSPLWAAECALAFRGL